jgi:flagellin
MSVTINTNSAAAIASNNLSASNAMLQKSLNRLSSGSKIVNASDDAGGVAVATRLSAAAKRSGVVNANIGNALSFLQNQDSALKTMGKMLERMSELQTLHMDQTKQPADIALYEDEFDKLKTAYTSITTQQFNGTDLFQANAALKVSTGEESNGASTGVYTLSDNSAQINAATSWGIGDAANRATVTGNVQLVALAASKTLIINDASGNSHTINFASGDEPEDVLSKINSSAAGISGSASPSSSASAGPMTARLRVSAGAAPTIAGSEGNLGVIFLLGAASGGW